MISWDGFKSLKHLYESIIATCGKVAINDFFVISSSIQFNGTLVLCILFQQRTGGSSSQSSNH